MITNTGAKYYKGLHEKSWSGYSEKQVKLHMAK